MVPFITRDGKPIKLMKAAWPGPRKKHAFLWDKTNELALENWELFDMENDRTEMNNIAANHPSLVKKMADMRLVWGKRTGIVPRPYEESS